MNKIEVISKWAARHAPELLLGAAIGGVGVTVATTAQAAIEVKDRLDAGVPTKDAVLDALPSIVPAAAATGLTITSIVLLHKTHRNREAAMAAAAAMWQAKAVDLEKFVRSKPKGAETLQAFHNEEMAKALPEKGLTLRKGEILVYEPMSKQFFISNNQEITSAELVANKIMQREGALTLNEFLRLFRNARPYVAGDGIGWFKTSDQWQYAWDLYGQAWIDLIPYQATVKGKPCVYLDYGVQMTTEDPLCPPTINGRTGKNCVR